MNKCLICGKELTKEETKNMFGFSVCCDNENCINQVVSSYRKAMEFFANIGGRTTI